MNTLALNGVALADGVAFQHEKSRVRAPPTARARPRLFERGVMVVQEDCLPHRQLTFEPKSAIPPNGTALARQTDQVSNDDEIVLAKTDRWLATSLVCPVTIGPEQTGHRTHEFVTHPFLADQHHTADGHRRTPGQGPGRSIQARRRVGLRVLVRPNGFKWWRYRYRFWGRDKMLSVGVYPGTLLSHARALAGAARELLGQGKDPGAERVIARKTQDTSFESVAGQLLAAMEKHVHARRIDGRRKNFFFPKLGSRLVGEITPKELPTVLKDIEIKGQYETARRAKQRAGQIFRHAIGLVTPRATSPRILRESARPLSSRTTPPSSSRRKSALMRALYGCVRYACSGNSRSR